MQQRPILLKNVRVHNLQSVDITIDPNQLVVFSGVSGSGKSSLAFDTLFVEGQRRYVESLSTFARRAIGDMSRPDVEHVSGLSPTISIEQKTAGRNPRSTVGTMTEIYDYLRVLYARIGIAHCPVSGEIVTPQSQEQIIRTIQSLPSGTKIILLAPYAKGKKAAFKEDFQELLRKGFMRVRVDGEIFHLEEEISLDGNIAHDVEIVIDRFSLSTGNKNRIADSITHALEIGEGLCSTIDDNSKETLYSRHSYSPSSGLSYQALEPHDFSFNSPFGMCPSCEGLGVTKDYFLEKIIDSNKSIADDCCSIASSYQTVRFGNIYNNLAREYGFNLQTPWKNLSEKAKKVFLYGTEKKWSRMLFIHPVTGAHWYDHVQWRGVLWEAHRRYSEAKSDSYRKKMEKLMQQVPCQKCQGKRLKPYPAATTIHNVTIGSLCKKTINNLANFFDSLALSEEENIIAEELVKEIRERLQFLLDVGLHYLTLDRTAPTLSGGEAQRVRLASQIGSGLVGVTYILDEPSIGLHPRDNDRLIKTLRSLADVGNTVVVVEHDEDTILAADRIFDFGPGAGVNGGKIIVDGSITDLLNNKESLTGAYLSGKLSIKIPEKRRKPSRASIRISGAKHHNLKNVNAKIPLKAFIAVTGVSGSGKSSLISDILHPVLANALHNAEQDVGEHKTIKGIENIDKVIAIDQTPIGRNPRSNPSTYIKIFDEIRDLFTKLPESRARGYKPGRFSFNVKEGSCPRCQGVGQIRVDMDFMEAAWVDCPQCHTRRFDTETLSVLYKGKSIADILEMDVSRALEFFCNIPTLKKKLSILERVGMGYIKLGQPSTTLSGGEAQRIKLAKELVRPSTGKTLYIFDEPTTGLHFHDIKHLLEVLHELVDRGNTVLVIEHNMEVIKTADWIIDLGPEGGQEGGEIVATGTPEEIATLKTPTGKAIQTALKAKKTRKKLLNKKAKNPKKTSVAITKKITITGANQHNLKHVDIEIPREKISILTGPSGSGKSSLAFDTLYAEGQRRYAESLSSYARQFVKQMPKPLVEQIEGLSPAIAIEQKAHAGNPRSTVGTMTEVYDFLRILFSRTGTPHCPETGEEIRAISKDHVVDTILEYPQGERLHILAPIEIKRNEAFSDIISRYRRQGFLRIRLNDTFYDLDSDTPPPYNRRKKNALFIVVDRLKADPTSRNRLFEAVENAAMIANNQVVVMTEQGDTLFNLRFAVASTGKSYPEITPHTFSFNASEGMCPECQGLGYQYGANLIENYQLMDLSITGLMNIIWNDHISYEALYSLKAILSEENINPREPLYNLNSNQLKIIMNGTPEGKWYSNNEGLSFRWIGINNVLAKAGKAALTTIKEKIIPLLDEHSCFSCQGARLNDLARHVTIKNKNLHDLCRIPLRKTLDFIDNLTIKGSDAKLLEEVMEQLQSRLRFLCQVGLDYMSLERRAPTLSGGETQRIRLARQLGTSLTGVLYVLDEPTIGLHPHDNEKLNAALHDLKNLGNTLVMVEHDPLTINTADYIIDLGPEAGDNGGTVTAKGSLKQLMRNKKSLTAAYLSGKTTIPIPKTRRNTSKEQISIKNAALHNLKNIDASIPIGALTCVTGVSGSGKSTLINDILYPAVVRTIGYDDKAIIHGSTIEGISAFNQVINIDQNPIGRTVRSDVATYTDIMTPLRNLFSRMPEARARGLQPKHFSYNHRRGMCTNCWGMGYKRVELHFLPPVRIPCPECQGLRLNKLSLSVQFQGKNLGEYLEITIEEAKTIFANHRNVIRVLNTLINVGLGYLKIGQRMQTLSGGEQQRIKLSKELGKRSSGQTLYLLDEPTTGLHSSDIEKLLKVLHALVDKGNTVVVIEHNIDIIKNADHIIDLGPDAGAKGGKIVCSGTPEKVAKSKKSHTAKYISLV